jgi:hypothetical protein
VLRANGRKDLRVFVIWEPVLMTDWGTPSPSLTSYVPDARALHYWDRGRRLSAMFGGAAKLPSLARMEQVGFRMKDVVWDTALLYPAGTEWGQPAKLLLAPVIEYQDELTAALR